MNKSLVVIVALVAVVAWSQPAQAELHFQAVMTHDQEVATPPIPDEGSSGFGTFILNDEMNALSYDVTLSGLDLDGLQTPGDPNDNVTRTHIHAAAAGSNGGIVFGQIDPNASLRNDLDDLVVNPATGRISGVWDNNEGNNTTLSAQLANLLAGNLYFNVHTADHGGGEIRGQIVLVPEPASFTTCLIGAASLCFMRRRRGV